MSLLLQSRKFCPTASAASCSSQPAHAIAPLPQKAAATKPAPSSRPPQKKPISYAWALHAAILALSFVVYPQYYAALWTLTTALLLVFRIRDYLGRGFGWYLADMCYPAQILLLTHVWLDLSQYSTELYGVMFVLEAGVLLPAVAAWGNCLMFDDMSRLLSFYLHFLPSTVLYVQRWRLGANVPVTMSAIPGLVGFLVAYAVFQFVVMFIFGDRLRDCLVDSSFAYMFRAIGAKFWKLDSDWWLSMHVKTTFWIFYIHVWLYGAAAAALGVLLWNYQYLHLGLILAMLLVGINNGQAVRLRVKNRNSPKPSKASSPSSSASDSS